MLGKQVKFEDLRWAQRAAIRKLERVNGWEAVTITRANGRNWAHVIFDTGPRRMDFASVTLCHIGWSVTDKDRVGKSILTDEEFQNAMGEYADHHREQRRLDMERLLAA